MLDIHANMLFVASRLETATRVAPRPMGATPPNSRVNHKADHVRLIAPGKPR